jgi:DNA-binding MarR family transcriptional regulator
MAEKEQPATKLRFDSPLQELYLNLWRTYDRLRELEDELFDEYELNSLQYNVLRLLKAAQPHAMATLAIAERLVSRAPDITRLLDRMVERSLIERIRSDEDRRQVLARITSEGIKLLHTIAGPLEKCHQRQLGHLTDAEAKNLIELLQAARRPHERPGSAWKK